MTRVAGATVDYVLGSDTYTGTTNSNGYYEIYNIPVGTYAVTASQAGFAPETQTSIVIANLLQTWLDFTLLETTEGTISGVVYQPDGTTPQSNATVNALQLSVVIRSTTTASDGSYSMDLPAGDYDVEAEFGQFYAPAPVPPLTVTVTVTAGATDSVDDLVLGEGGRGVGIVYRSDGVARVAGATVEYLLGVDTYTAVTNSNGYYEIFNIPVGTYAVTASQAGFTPQTQTSITITNLLQTWLDFTLLETTEGTISGVVYQPDGTTPQSNATVNALQLSVVIRSTTTASDGSYSMDLPAGDYDVEAEFGQFYAPAPVPPLTVTVTVTAGATDSVDDLVLGEGGRGVGIVYRSDGVARVAGATVEYLLGVDTYTAVTNSNGYYEIFNIPVGTYAVTASQAGFTPQTQTSITITNLLQTWLDFTLLETTEGTITGVVYQPDGLTPQSNAIVSALQLGVVIRSTTTAGDGSYSMDMPAGAYDVEAEFGEFYVPAPVFPVTVTVTVAAEATAPVDDLVLGEGGIGYGYVFDSDGVTPITGATVEFSLSGDTYTTTTNPIGYYEIYNIPVGTYDVTVSQSGFTSQTLPSTIINLTWTRVDFTLL